MKLIKLNGINEKDAQVPKTKKRFWIQGIISCFNPRSRERADLNRSDRCQDCVDAPYLQTRNKDYHKAVLKLANDADVSPNDYKLYQLKSDDMSNLTMQSTFMWTLLKCMEGNAQRFGGGLAGVLHPSLWTDWPNTISQRNSMVEGLVRNYLVAPGPEMNWLLFPIQFDNRWILLICNSLLQKIHILDPMESNATVPVDTAKISLIFDIVTNQKLKVFELKAVNAPSNEQSSLYIMRYAEVFLNAPTWTGQCGVEHKFDEANFRNKVLWFLKPFKQSELDATRTMNKVVYLDRSKEKHVKFSTATLKQVKYRSSQSEQICFNCKKHIDKSSPLMTRLRHYHEFHDRFFATKAGNIFTPNTALAKELYKEVGPLCLEQLSEADVKRLAQLMGRFLRELRTKFEPNHPSLQDSKTKRRSYVYLLLDSAHLQRNPMETQFDDFVASIVYIGKGTCKKSNTKELSFVPDRCFKHKDEGKGKKKVTNLRKTEILKHVETHGDEVHYLLFVAC